jgi:uncharacterized protein YdeI (YjbR/CyaY-like superfamily)
MKCPAKTRGKSGAKKFEGTLERLRSNLGWTIVFVPFDAAKVWGGRGNLRVKGDINGFPLRTSLFPTREGRHFLLINKKMQAGAGVRLGDVAEIRLEPDTEERVASVPPELRTALSQDRALLKWFGQLNYSMRKWIGDQVTQPRSAGARVRRAEQLAEQLMCAMEAELELPPLLKLAFAREPEALRGWNLLTTLKRRSELLAIFHYRTPEARDRRIEKTMEAALAMAERKPRE